MICELLAACLISVSHAPGWSDAVVSVEIPHYSYQLKDIEVTDGNHVHQIWHGYADQVRVGYNVLLPDGAVLSTDTLLSRDVWSAYCSSALIGTDFFGVWRENDPIWYALNDHNGNPLVAATLFSTAPWPWWHYVAVSTDGLGRVHMTYDAPGGIWYSVMIPGGVETFRDTIPQSKAYSLIDVSGDRVHILYKNDGGDYLPRYIQYDLNGIQTLAPISLLDPVGTSVENRWGMCSDVLGNACVFLKRNADNAPLLFFRIDKSTGNLLVDGRVIYMPPSGVNTLEPNIVPGPGGTSLNLLWTETTPGVGSYKLIRHAVIDLDGNFIVTPYTAYDYTDESPENIQKLEATTNDVGDLFINYSEGDPAVSGYWIRLGWFDHNYLGIVDDSTESESPWALGASSNPFFENLIITCEGPALPGQLMVYDITGRLVRSLSDRQQDSFLWDGRDASGTEVPGGTYLIQGAVDGQVSSVRVVRL